MTNPQFELMLISCGYKKKRSNNYGTWYSSIQNRPNIFRKDNVLVIGNFRYNKELLTDDDVQSAISHPSGRIYPKGPLTL